jgi:hypothetical protein
MDNRFVIEGQSLDELRRPVSADGMWTLRMDGTIKVFAGLTCGRSPQGLQMKVSWLCPVLMDGDPIAEPTKIYREWLRS